MNHHFFKTIMFGAFAAAMILGVAGCKKAPSGAKVTVTAFSLSATSLELKIDETNQLDVLFFPENANKHPELVWESDNDKVVTVSQEGLVTAVGVGKTVVTARTSDGSLSETCMVRVWKYKDLEFSEEIYYIWGGAEHPTQLTFTPIPSTTVATDFNWKLDFPDILELELGKEAYARALKTGKSYLTVTPKDGDASLAKKTNIKTYKYRFKVSPENIYGSGSMASDGLADGATIDLTSTFFKHNGHPVVSVRLFGGFNLEPDNIEIMVEDDGVVDVQNVETIPTKNSSGIGIVLPLGTKKGSTAKLTVKNTMNAEDGSVLNTYTREFTLLVPESTTTE